MKKYTGKYVIRWIDKDNNANKKVYNDYPTTLKAKSWLIANGAVDIDIAVQLVDDKQ